MVTTMTIAVLNMMNHDDNDGDSIGLWSMKRLYHKEHDYNKNGVRTIPSLLPQVAHVTPIMMTACRITILSASSSESLLCAQRPTSAGQEPLERYHPRDQCR